MANLRFSKANRSGGDCHWKRQTVTGRSQEEGATTSQGATQEAPGQSGDRRRGAEMRARAFIVVSAERNRHGRGTGPRIG